MVRLHDIDGARVEIAIYRQLIPDWRHPTAACGRLTCLALRRRRARIQKGRGSGESRRGSLQPWSTIEAMLTDQLWFRFIVAALATWRITHLIVREDGPWRVIVRIRRSAGAGFWGE